MSETVAPAQLIETTPSPAETPAPAETLLTTAAEPAAPPAPVVPDKYEFTAPEVDGKPVAVDPEALGGFETTAREAGLTQEQFAKLAPYGVQVIQQQVAKVAAELDAKLPAYLRTGALEAAEQAITSDPEFGGPDKLGQTKAYAIKAIEEFGGKELLTHLIETKMANDPKLLSAFIRIGKKMGDAETLITGKPANQKGVSPEAHARNFYNERGGNYPALEG